MVQLKQVSLRLKSIKNIQKITKTMKMVSASKFTKAERELAAARPFGYGPRKFYEMSKLVTGRVDPHKEPEELKPPEKRQVQGHASSVSTLVAVPPLAPGEDAANLKRIYIAMTSDKGLCGGVHSGVVRRIRRDMTERNAQSATHRLVCVGDKSRGMMWRQYAGGMLVSIKDVGRISPVFADASKMAATIADAAYTYDLGEIFYNKYFTPVKYELTVLPFFNQTRIEMAPNMHAFDDVESDILESYVEWTLVAMLYYALKQGAAAEQSARMAAMDNATKNANDIIRKLTLLFNRTRQAVITRELIEIISGAIALEN